jgi:hypothetical protein
LMHSAKGQWVQCGGRGIPLLRWPADASGINAESERGEPDCGSSSQENSTSEDEDHIAGPAPDPESEYDTDTEGHDVGRTVLPTQSSDAARQAGGARPDNGFFLHVQPSCTLRRRGSLESTEDHSSRRHPTRSRCPPLPPSPPPPAARLWALLLRSGGLPVAAIQTRQSPFTNPCQCRANPGADVPWYVG